ncbi:hypothetical protein ASPSYDRAFT_177278 [Aspergillus sydowii CBS 593.65]|uniref:Uncharacterized protein n=1 Tax=Aspergillus sydowii CBS 593.65 TaxID=1036612 RepID=A0A1L9TGK9_9EURO|nr:uncharacterized protein ASPSYDRAFT_177278 [Aspergillus sydowii CBS 593.65]OJJ58570.1 hypothetical protein ASPSYDRAFT_177278 [Aspergillus sydowii CBS 593.65]
MRFFSAIIPLALVATSNALNAASIKETDDGFAVVTAQCSDDYFTCIANCPLSAPAQFCITWPLSCAIIYC